MINRRSFVRNVALGTIGCSLMPKNIFAKEDIIRLTILHTNDMHSHIEPIVGGRNNGLGGMAQRAALINKIREENEHVLLLDAGDIFQGTPYFNWYGGELEFKLMSKMGYDAATLGNHDFDNGLEGLNRQLPHANFPFLCANYDFAGTLLHDKFLPFKIIKKGELKIGIFGIGIELDGLVPKALYDETIYIDPIERSNYFANLLKNELDCDLVICLSHLGYSYKEQKISDIILAEQTKNINLIIGGHTHTFLDKPVSKINAEQKEVMIAQVGWAGIKLGRIDYTFSQKKMLKNIFANNILVKSS